MNNKAQAWYIDFTIGLAIFAIGIVVYFNFIQNIDNEVNLNAEQIQKESITLSSTLLTSGFPQQWGVDTVVRAGIESEDQVISSRKVNRLAFLNVTEGKKVLGIKFDYGIFFLNSSQHPIAVGGHCVIGSYNLNSSSLEDIAYYEGSTDHLSTWAQQTFNTTIYTRAGGDLPTLVGDLSNYDAVVFEQAQLQNSDLDTHQADIETYVTNGGIIAFVGDSLPPARTVLGVQSTTKASQTQADRNATVVGEQDFFLAQENNQLLPDQATYVTNMSIAANQFAILSRFTDDNTTAAAVWEYGSGKVVFMSDSQGSWESHDLSGVITSTISSSIAGACDTPELDHTPQHLIRSERFVNLNEDIATMVVFLWN